MKIIKLKKREEKRLLNGHAWIFSNEIGKIEGNPTAGDIVKIITNENIFLGIGFYNPHSLISVRFLSSDVIEINKDFFVDRIKAALNLRKILFPASKIYRLVYGESDQLPGLIIDRFNEQIVFQTFSFGMDLRINEIVEAIKEILNPACIIEKNNSQLRKLENLPERTGILFGEIKNEILQIEGINYKLNLMEGQKTGFFLDQRLNRIRLARYAKNKNVLDAFCNEGGFGLSALKFGANSVDFVDISEHAINQTKENAKINIFNNCNFFTEDVFEYLKKTDKKYNLIILDPPSFTKSKKNVFSAQKGYLDLHRLALKVLEPNGILVSASCSHHIPEKDFFNQIALAAVKEKRNLKLLENFGASCDHPVLPSMPETSYLKCGYFFVN